MRATIGRSFIGLSTSSGLSRLRFRGGCRPTRTSFACECPWPGERPANACYDTSSSRRSGRTPNVKMCEVLCLCVTGAAPGGGAAPRLGFEAVFDDFAVQGAAADIEHAGGFLLVPLDGLEHPHDVRAL